MSLDYNCPNCEAVCSAEPSSIGGMDDRLLYNCSTCGIVSEEHGVEIPLGGAVPAELPPLQGGEALIAATADANGFVHVTGAWLQALCDRAERAEQRVAELEAALTEMLEAVDTSDSGISRWACTIRARATLRASSPGSLQVLTSDGVSSSLVVERTPTP